VAGWERTVRLGGGLSHSFFWGETDLHVHLVSIDPLDMINPIRTTPDSCGNGGE
jgi:hypothetical protein